MATNFPTSVDNFTNPTANDSLNLPSHSTQHANANDAIEAIEGVLVPAVNAWTAYTPTFTNLTVGNGTVNAFYSKIGKTVLVRLRFVFGSTSSISGELQATLPFPNVGTSLYSPQKVRYFCGGVDFIGDCFVVNTTFFMRVGLANTTYLQSASLSATVPLTWGTNAEINAFLVYETSA